MRTYYAQRKDDGEFKIVMDNDDGCGPRTVAGLDLSEHKAELVASALNEAHRSGLAMFGGGVYIHSNDPLAQVFKYNGPFASRNSVSKDPDGV